MHLLGKLGESRKKLNGVLEKARSVSDKALMIECFLLEAKIHYSSRNYPAARSSITSCRSNSATAYVRPLLQADIDRTVGLIYLAEDDHGVAFSYFHESLEVLHKHGHAKEAAQLFDYMLVCKLVGGQTKEAEKLVRGRYGVEYSNEDSTVLLILKAYESRSLVRLNKVIAERGAEIDSDGVLQRQIRRLYDKLLSQNVLKLVKPYNRVQIGHLSRELGVPTAEVEAKLCEMILDEKLRAVID